MDAKGLGYQRSSNCFTWLEDFAVAQHLSNARLRTNWAAALDELLRAVHPAHEELFPGRLKRDYYWTVAQSEWACDVMFDSTAYLKQLFARILRHGMTSYGPLDVLHFLGKRVRMRRDGQGMIRARWHRGLNPLTAEDAALLIAVSRPEFTQNGLRNRDLCALLYATPPRDAAEGRHSSAAVSRKLSLLCAHRLLQKVPKIHRYVVPARAQNIIHTILSARNADAEALSKLAALKFIAGEQDSRKK